MIPARLGSKRIPKKNIRYMGDKPLIQYPIDLVIGNPLFSEVYVSTESKELAKIIEKLGASFHERPMELAGDKATNRDFTYEFLKKHECDYVVMLNTTSPLLRKETLNSFMEFVDNNSYDTILSTISEKEETFFKGKPLNFSVKEKVNSQLLEPVESICWAMTAWRRDTFIRLQESGVNPVFGGNLGRFNIPKDEACDLDTIEDWRIAEGIMMSRSHSFEERYLEL